MKSPLSACKPGDSGPSVTHLQDALRTLVERGVIRSFDPPNRPSADELAKLSAALAAERAANRYGEATTTLVRVVQVQQSLGDHLRGVADEETVGMITSLIKPLASEGCGCGGARERNGDPQKDSRGRTDASWSAGVLAKDDAKALAAALAAAAESGVPRDRIQLIFNAVSDLSSLDRLALDALAGRTWFDDIAAVVDEFQPWGRDLPGRGRGSGPAPALALQSPGALPVAAFLAGALNSAPGDAGEFMAEEGLRLSRQSMTAFLWRAEPVGRVVYAARAWSEGQLGLEGFTAVLSDATRILEKPLGPRDLVSSLREGLTVLPFPSPIDPKEPWWPHRPPFSAWLLPENQAWAHCVLGLHRRFPPLPQIPAKAPPSGSISPGSVCVGNIPATGLEVRLHTPAGGSFGPREPTAGSGEMWGLSVNGSAVQILSWTNSEIRFATTALQPGCNKLSWTWSSNWTPDDNGVGAACSEALRIPPLKLEFGTLALIAGRTRFWTAPAPDLVVVGPTVSQLTASDGAGSAPAEACTPVTVSWQVSGLDCLAARALATLQLIRERTVQGVPERVVLHPNADPRGAVTESLDTTATYRIEIAARDDAGNSCGTSQASITVARQKLLRLTVPPQVIAGQPAVGQVTISCPAPANGLPIAFSVAPNGALAVPAVMIPAGANTASLTLSAGSQCGFATVTASAVDHSPASATTCALVPPTITSMAVPPATLACSRFTLSLVASCVTRPPALRAFAVAGGQRTPLSVTAPAGGTCGRNATLTLAVPELTPGTYSIILEDDGGSATATQTVTVTPNPLIVSAPRDHRVNISGSRCPRPDSSITVTVKGADTVAFSYPHPDGTITRTVTGGSAACDTWRATFTGVFDRTAVVTATPSLGGTLGPAASIPVVLSFGAAVASAVEIFASDPAGTGVARAAAIVRVETDPQSGMEQRTSDGSISNNTARTFPLNSCVETVFEYSRPEVADPISTSNPPAKIGAITGSSGPWHGHPEAPAARDQV